MDPKRILIIGNYGAGNLGDDAIFAGICAELEQIGFTGEITLTHGGFPSSSDIYNKYKKCAFIPFGIRSRFKSTRNEAKTAIKSADLVILGGGGLFIDSETIKAPLLWAKHAKICQTTNTPYICYGQSVGPIQHKLAQKVTREVFANALAIHVRDNLSKQTLENIGVQKNISVGTDPAFAYLSVVKSKSQKNNIGKRNTLIASLRTWDSDINQSWSLILKELGNFAQQANLKLELLAMDIRNLSEISQLKATGLTVHTPSSAKDAFFILQEANFACLMRLHAGIFALSAGTPFVSISYSQKVKSLFNSLKIHSGMRILQIENIQHIKENLSQIKSETIQVDLAKATEKNLNFLRSVFEAL